MPSRETQAALVDAYFAHNHLIYPVMSRSDFRVRFDARKNSKLRLISVLYAGGLHVDDAVIYRAGYSGRMAFLEVMYQQAKAVVDLDKALLRPKRFYIA